MRTSKIDDEGLLERLGEVFRRHGYEGASMSRIAKATGLQRASLYHRFPGGKEQMALAVLEQAARCLANDVLAPLRSPLPPADRLRRMIAGLREFYGDGKRSCFLDTLSLGEPDGRLYEQVRGAMAFWRGALEGLGRELGFAPEEARRRAEDVLVRVQGSLVVARVSGDPTVFERTLAGLPALLAAV